MAIKDTNKVEQDKKVGDTLLRELNEAYFSIPEIIEYCKKTASKTVEIIMNKIEREIKSSPYEMESIIKKYRNEASIRYVAIQNSGLEINANSTLEEIQAKLCNWMFENRSWKIPLAKGCEVDRNTTDCTSYIRATLCPLFQSSYVLRACDNLLFHHEDENYKEDNPNYYPISSHPGKYHTLNLTKDIQFYISYLLYLSQHNKEEIKRLFEEWFDLHLDKDWFITKLEKYVSDSHNYNPFANFTSTNEEFDIIRSIINKYRQTERSKALALDTQNLTESYQDKIRKILEPTANSFPDETHIHKIIAAFIDMKEGKSYKLTPDRALLIVELKDFIIPYKQLFIENLFMRSQIAVVLFHFVASDSTKKTSYAQSYFEKLLSNCKIK